MKVIIIGGGIGGLCLANGLVKKGVQVKVFERQSSPSEHLAGYGIHINAHGRHALQKCVSSEGWQLFEDWSTAAGSSMSFRDTDLRRLAERDDAQLSGRSIADVERRGIARVELRHLLLSDLKAREDPVLYWGKTFLQYENLPESRVRVHFADGSTEDGDVLVGADGCNSQIRQQYLPAIQRDDLGILAIAGRYILDRNRTRDLPRSFTDGSLNNIVPHGKGWMFITSWRSKPKEQSDSRGELPAEHYVMWAYVVPKAQTPANAKNVSAEKLRDLALSGTEGWSSIVRRMIKDVDLATVSPISLKSMPYLEIWQPTNVTLLGDAIHNMTPMAGIGANTALRDADLLTDLLSTAASTYNSQSIVPAIASYETAMREYANDAVALSRRNAEAASSTQKFQREAFRILLRVAQASSPVMRKTIGQSVIKEHLIAEKAAGLRVTA